jgi:L-lactate dehydrogenase complex protein LldG
MSSRAAILSAVKAAQPSLKPLPALPVSKANNNLTGLFSETLLGIGAQVHFVTDYDEVIRIISSSYDLGKRVVALNKVFASIAEIQAVYSAPVTLADVELVILETNLAVAENGAVWITDDQLPARVLPFIAQHSVVIVHKADIVANMHQAYDMIGDQVYGFGTFIAGPSKTADIEQSLVLGAHGPCSMMVFII